MAIKFFNVKSGETRVCDTEPMISAFWGSSNLSPNAVKGQDMGWRLAPEIVVRIEEIRQNPEKLEKISQDFKIPIDDLTDTDLLWYISGEDTKVGRIADPKKDFTEEYNSEIRRAKNPNAPRAKTEEEIRAEVRAEMEAEARANAESKTSDVVVSQDQPNKIAVTVEEKSETVTVRQKSSTNTNKDQKTK